MRIMFRKCNNEKCKKRRNDNKVIQVNEKILFISPQSKLKHLKHLIKTET